MLVATEKTESPKKITNQGERYTQDFPEFVVDNTHTNLRQPEKNSQDNLKCWRRKSDNAHFFCESYALKVHIEGPSEL